MDENEALRKEKTEMEQSLRMLTHHDKDNDDNELESTIQSMQLNMQEMSVQLAQTRLQYKVSVCFRMIVIFSNEFFP